MGGDGQAFLRHHIQPLSWPPQAEVDPKESMTGVCQLTSCLAARPGLPRWPIRAAHLHSCHTDLGPKQTEAALQGYRSGMVMPFSESASMLGSIAHGDRASLE